MSLQKQQSQKFNTIYMEYEDELPCGGYQQEDKKIQKNLQQLSLQADNKTVPKECKKQSCDNCECNSGCNCDCKCDCDCAGKVKKEQVNPAKKNMLCKKCKQNQAVLVHKNEVICRDCLMKNIQYKTRLTLENKIKVKGKSRILICFSGGLNSVCLVNILNNIKKRYQKSPLFGDLQCLHIQQQSNLPEGYIHKFQEFTGLKLNVLHIEKIYEKQQTKYSNILELFKQLPPSSNSQDLLEIFRNKLIIDFVKQNSFDFVMGGKNGESLATEIFKYFTKGIGGSVPQLCSSDEEEGAFNYPLRQHLQKQLQYYFYAQKLGKLTMLADQDDLSNYVSFQIDNLLNNFIINLQDKYSHTAPAIVRTGQKLKRKQSSEISQKCKWCYFNPSSEQGVCQKCLRLKQGIRKPQILQLLPNWMKF